MTTSENLGESRDEAPISQNPSYELSKSTKYQSDSLSLPAIDPNVEQQSSLPRTAEALKYAILSAEYSISPSGRLRKWAKYHFSLFLWIAIPIFLLVPPITYLFSALASISESVQVCVSNVMGSILPIAIIGLFFLIITALIRR